VRREVHPVPAHVGTAVDTLPRLQETGSEGLVGF